MKTLLVLLIIWVLLNALYVLIVIPRKKRPDRSHGGS